MRVELTKSTFEGANACLCGGNLRLMMRDPRVIVVATERAVEHVDERRRRGDKGRRGRVLRRVRAR